MSNPLPSRHKVASRIKELHTLAHQRGAISGSGWLTRSGAYHQHAEGNHSEAAVEHGLAPANKHDPYTPTEVALNRGHVRTRFYSKMGVSSLNVEARHINDQRRLQLKSLFRRWDHPFHNGNVMVETDHAGMFPNHGGKYRNFKNISEARSWAETI